MARFPLRAIDGPAGNGFELAGHGIFWPYDDEQPFMTVRGADGSELRRQVENSAFRVAVGGRDRRTRMKAAALEFFAPLLESTNHEPQCGGDWVTDEQGRLDDGFGGTL